MHLRACRFSKFSGGGPHTPLQEGKVPSPWEALPPGTASAAHWCCGYFPVSSWYFFPFWKPWINAWVLDTWPTVDWPLIKCQWSATQVLIRMSITVGTDRDVNQEYQSTLNCTSIWYTWSHWALSHPLKTIDFAWVQLFYLLILFLFLFSSLLTILFLRSCRHHGATYIFHFFFFWKFTVTIYTVCLQLRTNKPWGKRNLLSSETFLK